MKVVRKIIEIDEELCNGCGDCIPSCAEGALEIVDGKAKVIKDMYCDGLGACLGDCPMGALKLIEREADEFDEEAVEKLLAEKKKAGAEKEKPSACGCPSSAMQTFDMASSCAQANVPQSLDAGPSALTHWPVQIRLVPPTAPFLKGADLLVLADCVPVAYPALHQELMKGKVVMMGCPKFDDAQSYVDKFVDIFRVSGLKSVTVAHMEVPCCSGLPAIIEKAMNISGSDIEVTDVIISTRGDRLS